MNKKCFFTALTAAVIGISGAMASPTYNEAEWRIRPWEIIQGLQPHSQLVWDMSGGDLANWKVSGKGALSSYNQTKLWGENVAKLDLPPQGSVTITPPVPLEVKDADGLDVWIYGPLGTIPKIDFVIKDARDKIFRVPTSGCGSRWNKTRWWGLAAGLLPREAVKPVKITSIQFSRLSNRFPNDYLCFDRIGAYKVDKVDIADSSKTKNPFPVTEDGIMPIGMKEGAVNSASMQGDKYVFGYKGKDAEIIYTYTPRTGTLSDLSE